MEVSVRINRKNSVDDAISYEREVGQKKTKENRRKPKRAIEVEEEVPLAEVKKTQQDPLGCPRKLN